MAARNIRVTTSDFSNMRKDHAVYVDKTRLVYEMVHDDRAFFLARPRRFGKSLLVLVEAQSSWSPNIVLRLLSYWVQTLNNYFTEKKILLYKAAQVPCPKPELYVIVVGVAPMMKQTKTYNAELARKNNIISEANLLKEKYMFKYMYLSANFIKEMDEYRKDLRHTYKENGIDALMAKLREPEYMYLQYKSFYKLFDEIFLGIFPDFPEKVNGMLKDGKQINIKHKGSLPTEMRILAVIRLGITESRKIAEFLNTSVNTVYTYRTKMRYDSIVGPENFEENIKNIDC